MKAAETWGPCAISLKDQGDLIFVRPEHQSRACILYGGREILPATSV